MKILPTFIVLLITTALAAQDKSAVPEKLATLKTSYKAAISRATAPITKTFLIELERLKTDYTKMGDLQAALAVDAELKALAAATPTSVPADDPDLDSTDDLSWLVGKSLVYGTYWQVQEDRRVSKIQGDGPPHLYRYTVEPDGRIRVLNDHFRIKTKNRAILYNGVDDQKGTEIKIVPTR